MANATGQAFALNFNGSSTKIDASNSLVPASGDFTIEAWVNLDNVANGTDEILVFQNDAVTSGQGLYLFATTDFAAANNEVRAYFSDGSSTLDIVGNDIRGAGWVHIALARNGSNFYLYEDATQVATGTSTANIGSTNTDIGYRSVGASNYLKGDVCDIRFWNVARSQTEISNNKDAPLTGSETGLVAYYKLDEANGTTANDSTSNEYDETIVSGSWVIINSDQEWTKVADTLSGQELNSMVEFNDKIYACTRGGLLFEWNGTNAWIQVAPVLNSQTAIWHLKEFGGDLYGSTGPDDTGTAGRLFKWNGTNAWVQVANTLNSIDRIFFMEEFDSKLYGGTDTQGINTLRSGRLFEFNGTNAWVQVADELTKTSYQCTWLKNFNGTLYGGMGGGSGDAAIYEWNGTDAWVVLKDITAGETYFYLTTIGSKLYACSVLGTGKLFEVNTTTGALTEVASQLYAQVSVIPTFGSDDKIFAGTQQQAYLYEWNGVDAWTLVASRYAAETELRASLVYSQDNKLYGISNPSGYLLEAGGFPFVQTDAVDSIGSTTATFNGEIINDGGETITERGFAYNTTGTPNITDDTKVTVSGTTGVFDYDATGLTAETTYYVRAFATNVNGTGYGATVSFTTGTAGSPTTTSIFEVLEYQSTESAEAGTTTTEILITDHGLNVGDMIVNETRRGKDAERGARRVISVPTDDYFIVDSIAGQVATDSIRLYSFIDRTDKVKVQTLRCNAGNQGTRTLNLSMITDKDYLPQAGQYCRFTIQQNTTSYRYFLGIIQTTGIRMLSNSVTADPNDTVIMDISATSLNTVPSRRTIQVAYDAGTDFGDIVQDMVDDYLNGDGIIEGTIDTGAALDSDWYQDVISIGDVLDRCASESAYQWFINEEGELNFYAEPTSFTNATNNIDTTTDTFTDYRNVSIQSDIDRYLNKYFILGGYDERGNPIIISSEDFGESTDMQEVCGGTGVYGVMMRDSGITGSDYVTAGAGTTTTNINYTDHGQVVGDMIWNLTRNTYELVTAVVDADNFTVDAIASQTSGDIIVFFDKCNDIIQNAFKVNGRIPKVIRFETSTMDFAPGQKITIKIPEMGIASAETYVIDNVEVFDYTGVQGLTRNGWLMRITCVLRDSSNFSIQRLRNFEDFWSNF